MDSLQKGETVVLQKRHAHLFPPQRLVYASSDKLPDSTDPLDEDLAG